MSKNEEIVEMEFPGIDDDVMLLSKGGDLNDDDVVVVYEKDDEIVEDYITFTHGDDDVYVIGSSGDDSAFDDTGEDEVEVVVVDMDDVDLQAAPEILVYESETQNNVTDLVEDDSPDVTGDNDFLANNDDFDMNDDAADFTDDSPLF